MSQLGFRTIATCALGAMVFVVAACGSNGSSDSPLFTSPDAGEGGALGCAAGAKEGSTLRAPAPEATRASSRAVRRRARSPGSRAVSCPTAATPHTAA